MALVEKAKKQHDEMFDALKEALPEGHDADLRSEDAKGVMASAFVTITEAKIINAISDAAQSIKNKKDCVEKSLAAAVRKEKELGCKIRDKIQKAIMKEANQLMLEA